MRASGAEVEEFLMKYPHLARWVNECISCHHRGYKPEMPEPEFESSAYLPSKLRRLMNEMTLDQDGVCQRCRETSSKSLV